MPECKLHRQPGQGFTVRKVYGTHDKIRYLRCCECGEEFSERKNTTLWNCKIPEEKATSTIQPCSQRYLGDLIGRLEVRKQGRRPNIQYRIPHGAAHVQIIKYRQNKCLKSVEISYTHGSKKRIDQTLTNLGHYVPNTSVIERRNGVAHLMSKAQVRKTLAFAKREDRETALGEWNVTVYNWCRPHRSLRYQLPEPLGKKSVSSVPQQWQLA